MSETDRQMAAWMRVAVRALMQDENTPESERLSLRTLVALSVELVAAHLAEQGDEA